VGAVVVVVVAVAVAAAAKVAVVVAVSVGKELIYKFVTCSTMVVSEAGMVQERRVRRTSTLEAATKQRSDCG
jgi:hypothetical protein